MEEIKLKIVGMLQGNGIEMSRRVYSLTELLRL